MLVEGNDETFYFGFLLDQFLDFNRTMQLGLKLQVLFMKNEVYYFFVNY